MDNNVLLEMLIEQKELIKSVDKKINTQQIAELENIFEDDRDRDKICQMDKDIYTFEEVIYEKDLLDEQNRLNKLEADKLNQKIESFKSK